MYFVAPKSFEVVVRRDVTERFRDNNNNLQNIEQAPVVYARFERDRPIPYEYRQKAVAFFHSPKRAPVAVNPDHPNRATAYLPNGITGLGMYEGGQTADEKGHTAVYEGQTPASVLGILNTDDPTQVHPDEKELVEAHLLDPTYGYGWRWIHFDSPIPTPWESYDNFGGEGVVKKIIDRIEDDGIDPHYVLAYEQANKKRLAVIKALGDLIVAQASA